MTVGKICSRQVVTVHKQITVAEAAQIMRGRHVGALLVTNKENIAIGIITDRDLTLDVLAIGGDPATLIINDLMSAPLICCQEDDSVSDAIRVMRKNGIRRLPVVSDEQHATGIFTLDDAVDHLGLMLGDLIGIMKSEFNREKKARG